MSITSDMDAMQQDHDLWQKIDKAKATVQGFRNRAVSTKTELDELAQEFIDTPGLFAELPDSIKTVLLAERTLIESVNAALENADIAEHLDRKPK